MNKTKYPEILLVRLTKAQKNELRKIVKWNKVNGGISEAEIVRQALDHFFEDYKL